MTALVLGLEPIDKGQAELELAVLNSDPYFNKVCKGKKTLSALEALEHKEASAELGAVRYFIKEGEEIIGIMEYLLHNPGDGRPWLGLLLIRKELQGQGYGKRALSLFESILQKHGKTSYRIGVVAGNKPARRFWRARGFVKINTVSQDNRLVDIYEKKADEQG